MQKIKTVDYVGDYLVYTNTIIRNSLDKSSSHTKDWIIRFRDAKKMIKRFNNKLPSQITKDNLLWMYCGRGDSLHNPHGPASIDLNTGRVEYWFYGFELTKEAYTIEKNKEG